VLFTLEERTARAYTIKRVFFIHHFYCIKICLKCTLLIISARARAPRRSNRSLLLNGKRKMRLRVRTPLGVANLVLHDSRCPTLNDFLSEMHKEFPERTVETFLFGFPKGKAFFIKETNGEEKLADFGIRDGETITIKFVEEENVKENTKDAIGRKEEEKEGDGDGDEKTVAGDAKMDNGCTDLAEAIAASEQTTEGHTTTTRNSDNSISGEEEAIARAVEASMLDERRTRGGSTSALPNNDPVVEDIDDDGTIAIRKVIDSDNSCLFNAIGYVFYRSLGKSEELRKVVHDAVLNDPNTFNEATLGKSPKEYAEWVLKPKSWGGQVELFVLSTYLQKQIAAYDIQTGRVDIYGEDRFPQSERGHLIYDGLHYDALVFAYPGLEDLPDTHVTVIDCSQPISKTNAFDAKARALAEKDRARRMFTDTANFSLRCLVCQEGLVGENEAREHAKKTGHQNFGEY